MALPVSLPELIGSLKGRAAVQVFKKFPSLINKPYWGNHFRAPGYCVDTVGIDVEMIKRYVKYQEKKDKQQEQMDLKFSK